MASIKDLVDGIPEPPVGEGQFLFERLWSAVAAREGKSPMSETKIAQTTKAYAQLQAEMEALAFKHDLGPRTVIDRMIFGLILTGYVAATDGLEGLL